MAGVSFPSAYGLVATGAPERITEQVYRWPTVSGDVAVKTFEPHDRARGIQEAQILAFLDAEHGGGYRVQALITTVDGKAWAEAPGSCVVVTQWAPGSYRTYDTFSPAEWSALGSSLATLHDKLDHFPLPMLDTLSAQLRRTDLPAAQARLGAALGDLPAHPVIDAGWVARYRALCLALLEACAHGALSGFPSGDLEQAIHNDYNQFNYLFDDELPPRILDWEAAIGAPREFEVVRCLNHLPLQAPAMANAFMRGYTRLRALDPSRMAWAVDVSCLMHATKHWLLDGWIQGLSGYDARLLSAMEMVTMLSRGRESLVAFFEQAARGRA